MAADTLTVNKGIEVEEAYTDNVRLTPTNQQSDWVTRIGPRLSVRENGARVQLALDYALDRFQFAQNSDGNRFSNSLTATGKAELLEDLFFVDASASVADRFINASNAVSSSDFNITDNRSSVQNFNVSPYVRNHLGTFADLETRYTFRSVSSDTQDLADTLTNEGMVTLSSGREFERLGWSLMVDAENTHRGQSTTFGGSNLYQRRTAESDWRYSITREIALIGMIGYEKIKDNTLGDHPNGRIWNMGFRLTPGPRTDMSIAYGERFNGNTLDMDANYRPTSRTTLSAGYHVSITSSQQLLSQQVSFLGTDASGQFIDTRTGLPVIPLGNGLLVTTGPGGNIIVTSATGTLQSLVNESFKDTQFTVSGSTEVGRNTFTAQVYNDERVGQVALDNQTVTGGVLGWSRRLTHHVSLNTTGRYEVTDFGGIQTRTDNLLTANVGLTYQMREDLKGWLNYNLTNRDSTSSSNNLTENVVSIGLRKDF